MPQENIIQLLLDLLRFDATPVRKADLAQLSPAGWQALYDLAAQQRVVAFLYHRLKAENLLSAAPEDMQQSLLNVYRQNAVRNMRLYHEFRQIAGAFQAASIPLIVLKGAYLAEAVYQNIALRQMGDMDLLVPRDKLAESVCILEKHDYEALVPFTIEVDTAVAHHLTRFVKTHVASIELHWSLTRPDQLYSIDVRELWERCVPLQIAEVDVLGLSLEDLLLHLCLHISYQHQFDFGLRFVCDIAQVIQRYGEQLNWELVQERAEHWGWQRGVYLALEIASRFVGAAVPSEVLAALRPIDFSEELYSTAITQTFDDSAYLNSRRLADMRAQNNWWGKLNVLRKAVFIPKVSIAKSYSLHQDSPLIYLYYLVRVKDMIARNINQVRHLQQGDPDFLRLLDRTYSIQDWLFSTK